MKRVAIFVEGQSELVFVREFLLKWFNYDVDLECRALRYGDETHKVDYDFPNAVAPCHFQIINVGMDGLVLPQILRQERRLYNVGYELIIGLRDMFCELYIKKVKDRTMDLIVNDAFIKENLLTINEKDVNADQIRLCFAIMEIEAWWLGISSLWEDIDPITREQYKLDFASPESVFHPAVLIKKLCQAKGKEYDKHQGEVESIVGKIEREHYVDLHESQRFPSFCEFVNYIQTT